MKNCVAKATKSSSVDNVFFPGHMRCLANGNFDPLQCVDRTASEDLRPFVDRDIQRDVNTATENLLVEQRLNLASARLARGSYLYPQGPLDSPRGR